MKMYVAAFCLVPFNSMAADSLMVYCRFQEPSQVSHDNAPLMRHGLRVTYLLKHNGSGHGGEPKGSTAEENNINNLTNKMSVYWRAVGANGYILRIQGQNDWFSDTVSYDSNTGQSVFSRLDINQVAFIMKGECTSAEY